MARSSLTPYPSNSFLTLYLRLAVPGSISRPMKPKRPSRVPGSAVSGVALPIPDANRKKFAAGWIEHVPLTCLTNAYCQRATTDTKTQRDSWSFDESAGGFIAVAKPLPVEGEISLNFEEWHQAWQ